MRTRKVAFVLLLARLLRWGEDDEAGRKAPVRIYANLIKGSRPKTQQCPLVVSYYVAAL
jgi:hypothetical protein